MSSNANATGVGGTKIRNHVRALNLVLIAAESAGVEAPEAIRLDQHDIDLLFFDLEALLSWVTWAEADASTIRVSTTETTTHHNIKVEVLDQELALVAVVPLLCRKCRQPQRDHTDAGLVYDVGSRTERCAYTPATFAFERTRAAGLVTA